MTVDTHTIATVLSKAFADDPLISSFFPHPHTHCDLSYYTFRFLVNHTLNNGEVSLAKINNHIVGGALWLPSEHIKRSVLDEIRYGGLAMLRHQSISAIRHQMRVSKQMAVKHHSLLATSHYYLSVLGLRPEVQGQGLATPLITPMLEQADRDRKACYLDTHKEINLNLYRHYGFKVVDQDVMKGSSVKHWMMIREPR